MGSQRLDEDNEEEVDDVEECVAEEEYVPEEGEMKGVLEEKIFGGLLPKAVRKLKPPRKGISERTGRGGRNETNNGAPETVVLGAVNYMLGNTVDGERPTLSLNSLFGRKMKKRRKIPARRKRWMTSKNTCRGRQRKNMPKLQ